MTALGVTLVVIAAIMWTVWSSGRLPAPVDPMAGDRWWWLFGAAGFVSFACGITLTVIGGYLGA